MAESGQVKNVQKAVSDCVRKQAGVYNLHYYYYTVM